MTDTDAYLDPFSWCFLAWYEDVGTNEERLTESESEVELEERASGGGGLLVPYWRPLRLMASKKMRRGPIKFS